MKDISWPATLTCKACDQNVGEHPAIEKALARSYLDTLFPFAIYRFLDEFHRALGKNLNRAFEPPSPITFLKKPGLLFYAFFGFLFPSAEEPSILAKKK